MIKRRQMLFFLILGTVAVFMAKPALVVGDEWNAFSRSNDAWDVRDSFKKPSDNFFGRETRKLSDREWLNEDFVGENWQKKMLDREHKHDYPVPKERRKEIRPQREWRSDDPLTENLEKKIRPTRSWEKEKASRSFERERIKERVPRQFLPEREKESSRRQADVGASHFGGHISVGSRWCDDSRLDEWYWYHGYRRPYARCYPIWYHDCYWCCYHWVPYWRCYRVYYWVPYWPVYYPPFWGLSLGFSYVDDDGWWVGFNWYDP